MERKKGRAGRRRTGERRDVGHRGSLIESIKMVTGRGVFF